MAEPVSLRALAGPARLPFLILTPACVVLGVACVWRVQGALDVLQVLLVLIGALASHVSVNAFNEYLDFRSGLDATTSRTPFSGGSGSLPAQPALAGATLAMAVVALLIAATVGLYFLYLQGAVLLPVGLTGLLLVATYTQWWAYQPLMCLLAPGLGFGLLMVNGTVIALTGAWDPTAILVSVVPSLLVSDLLLLNQFPDVEADRAIGRRHFPITIGRPDSARLFAVLYLLAFGVVISGVASTLLPASALMALAAAPLAWRAARGAIAHADDIPALLPAMRLNVLVNLLTPMLLALGLALR